MAGLFELLGLVIFILSLVVIIAVVAYFDYKKNIAMIEKGLVPEDEKKRPEDEKRRSENRLGWGIVIMGTGISLLMSWRFHIGGEAILGLILASIGIALLVSYLIAKK